MDRRETLKTILLGSVSIPFLSKIPRIKSTDRLEPLLTEETTMESEWDQWPDMEWIGPDYWGNRLQDWQLRDGKVRCSVTAPNRTLHSLTHQVTGETRNLQLSVILELLSETRSAEDKIGFRIGAKAADDPVPVTFEDYRRDAIFGEGIEAGVQANGYLFIGNQKSDSAVSLQNPIKLTISVERKGNNCHLELTAINSGDGTVLDKINVSDVDPLSLNGNIALLSHFQSDPTTTDSPSALFSHWMISGENLIHDSNQTFGPICFSQYTLNRGTLKMTTQLAPVESIENHAVELQIKQSGVWQTVQTTSVDPLSRTAHFRQENWDSDEDIPYRIRLELPLKNDTREYFYVGTIAAEPISSDKLKTAVFSCNSHYGFPNQEVVENVKKHQPDVAVFLGDQLYESHGGFGIQNSPVEKAALDWLRKWYMFGWSYREIFRDIPSA
ncbi:MAG: twin-arginine translocation pathway signal protein, partial [Bacteroidetes bacterium]|nr:twin-arginine translocation pathway signal protein [Bacteroidota bacterium]